MQLPTSAAAVAGSSALGPAAADAKDTGAEDDAVLRMILTLCGIALAEGSHVEGWVAAATGYSC